MWKYRSRSINGSGSWMPFEQAGTTLRMLAEVLSRSKSNRNLLPLSKQDDGTFVSNGEGVVFRFEGVLPDGDNSPVTMTADFSLDELEQARKIIASLS